MSNLVGHSLDVDWIACGKTFETKVYFSYIVFNLRYEGSIFGYFCLTYSRRKDFVRLTLERNQVERTLIWSDAAKRFALFW